MRRLRQILLSETTLPNVEGESLRRAVMLAPADDAPRLIYADWLDEHDRADLARLIRDMVRNASQTYQFQPLKADPSAWPSAPGYRTCSVRRGFVEGIHLSFPAFLADAPSLFAIHPITSVRFHDLYIKNPRRRKDGVADLVPLHAGGENHWPVDFFPGLGEGDRLYADRRAHFYQIHSLAAVNYGRRLVGLPDLYVIGRNHICDRPDGASFYQLAGWGMK